MAVSTFSPVEGPERSDNLARAVLTRDVRPVNFECRISRFEFRLFKNYALDAATGSGIPPAS